MCKALYTKHTLNWFPRFPLLVCPAGRAKLECNTAGRVSPGFARYVFLVYVMHQSIPAAPSAPPPPWAIVGRLPTLSPCQSRGRGICKLCFALGPGICQPRGYSQDFGMHTVSYQNITTQRILLEMTNILAQLSRKGRNWRAVVKACSRFYACIFSLLIKPESHGEIVIYHDVNQCFLVKPKLNRISVDIIWKTSFHNNKTIRHNI